MANMRPAHSGAADNGELRAIKLGILMYLAMLEWVNLTIWSMYGSISN